MKRILCAILAVLMLCTMCVAMVSCGTSMESIEEKCKKLKEKGEITSYEVITDATILSMVSGAKKVISASKDKESFSAVEFKDKDTAKAYYEKQKEAIDKAKEADKESVKDVYLKLKGEIVIYGHKDLCKKIV